MMDLFILPGRCKLNHLVLRECRADKRGIQLHQDNRTKEKHHLLLPVLSLHLVKTNTMGLTATLYLLNCYKQEELEKEEEEEEEEEEEAQL